MTIESKNIDSIYYRDGASRSLSMMVLKRARMNMLKLFLQKMQPTASSRILDIGVSDEENDGANFLEKHYPWQHNITCAGIGSGELVRKKYPQIEFRQIIPNAPLPFPDKSFDIACSNAVIEHVGGPKERRAFILEHLRVARSVFITAPNRWFFVEHHTGLPFLHYMPGLFRRTLAGSSMDYWVKPANMDFIDRSLLLYEWPLAQKPEILMAGLPFGPFSSNLAMIYKSD